MLPLQLGKVNADGPQDLIVMTLTRKGGSIWRIICFAFPTDVDVPVWVKDVLPDLYRAMLTGLAARARRFVEYAWDMSWCDPCADDPLTYDEFRRLARVGSPRPPARRQCLRHPHARVL